jgi:hypothetical protein
LNAFSSTVKFGQKVNLKIESAKLKKSLGIQLPKFEMFEKNR